MTRVIRGSYARPKRRCTRLGRSNYSASYADRVVVSGVSRSGFLLADSLTVPVDKKVVSWPNLLQSPWPTRKIQIFV